MAKDVEIYRGVKKIALWDNPYPERTYTVAMSGDFGKETLYDVAKVHIVRKRISDMKIDRSLRNRPRVVIEFQGKATVRYFPKKDIVLVALD